MENGKFVLLKRFPIVNIKLVPEKLAKLEKESQVEKTKVNNTPEPLLTCEEEFVEGEHLQDIITEKSSQTLRESETQLWDDNMTLALLDQYQIYLGEFRSPKMKKKMLWDKIAKHITETFQTNVDGTYLDQKFRNMKNTFKKIKDNNKKSSTGRGRITWKYYDQFEAIFASDKTINPPSLISTGFDQPTHNVLYPSDAENSKSNEVTPTSSNSITLENCKSTRLEGFRKRQLAIEEARVEELKAIRLEISESNRINREKLALLKQHLDLYRK